MKTAIRHLIILFVPLFVFCINAIADKETIPLEGELKTIGVRSGINMPSVEVSYDQGILCIDFYRSFLSVNILVIDENNTIILDKVYDNPQSEMILLDFLSTGDYRIELHANGGMMWGWFSIY